MAQLNFDANKVDPTSTYDTFPKGDYVMCVRETDIKATKSNTGYMLEYTAEVLDGQYVGRKIFGRMNIDNQNPDAQAIGQRELSQLCHAVGVLQVSDSSQLHDKPFIAKVGIEVDKSGQYDDKNVIKQFKPIGQAGQAPTAPAFQPPAPSSFQPPATAPVGAKPSWAQ